MARFPGPQRSDTDVLRAVVSALLLIATMGWAPPQALAEARCVEYDETGECLIYLTLDSDVGGSGSAGGSETQPASGAPQRVCVHQGNVIECQTPLGNWSSLAGAWCRVAPTQPPVTDPAWGGNTEGAIYLCTRPGFDLTPDPNLTYTRWLPAPPEAVRVDPREVALRILARLDLEAVELGMFPRGDSDVRLSFVGWNNWMWAESPSQRQWGPLSSSDSASGITVTLTAEVERVEWDMGDDTVVTCGKATPWSQARTQGGRNVASPDCGHVYERMGTYTVTATSHWNVQWSGGGQSGSLPFSLSRSTDYLVGEYQAVNG